VLFRSGSIVDSTDPIVVSNSNFRLKHKLVFVWSTLLPATASAATSAGEPAYRIQVINAYMTSYKPSFDDKIFSAEVTFKWSPFNKAGLPNKREESTSSTTLGAATSSVTAFA